METNFLAVCPSFIFRKKQTGIESKYRVDSSGFQGWEYFFFDSVRNPEKQPLPNIEQLMPKGFTKELGSLPGQNAVLLLKDKMTLLHVGFLKSEHEIKQFADALLMMSR